MMMQIADDQHVVRSQVVAVSNFDAFIHKGTSSDVDQSTRSKKNGHLKIWPKRARRIAPLLSQT